MSFSTMMGARLAGKFAVKFVQGDPEIKVPQALAWLERFDRKHYYQKTYDMLRNIMKEPDNNWHKLICKSYKEVDDGVRAKFIRNFIVNSSIRGNEKRHSISEKYGCNIPWAILMDPTSACNLHCIGCWAAEYGNKLNMEFELLDDIIKQGKDLGIYFYLFSGGEPLVRKDDIIKLCKKHNDCDFLAFTNGTLIDEKFADQMLEVKNFFPAISVEGSEEATDARRGKGTYARVMRGMDILRERKLPFGFSTCYHHNNIDSVTSEEYVDKMIEKGAFFGWYFTYMPVGKSAPTDLLVTPEQRVKMYNTIRRWRSEKPIFLIDFQNDGEYISGCIAGGKHYFHINANGDAEPCAFIHYSDSNVREKKILDVLKSPLFMAYHENQPFSDNHLRPCPLMENNQALAKMVKVSGAHSTDCEAEEDAFSLCAKCKSFAEEWKPVANDLWKKSGRNVPLQDKEMVFVKTEQRRKEAMN